MVEVTLKFLDEEQKVRLLNHFQDIVGGDWTGNYPYADSNYGQYICNAVDNTVVFKDYD